MPGVANRKFTDKPITHSMAHHLSAVAHLLARGGYARVSDIARFLGLTRGSVSVSMKGLCSGGLVWQDGNHFFHLTEKGQRAANSLRTRYEIIKRFLTDMLGLGGDEAHEQSCQIAYLVTAPAARRLATVLQHSVDRDRISEISRRCPLGCPGCDKAGDRTSCPCCGLECLSEWLPPLDTRPPCQETLHDD